MNPGEYTQTHGGGTFSGLTLKPVEPETGYAVGLVQGTALTIEPVPGLFEMRRLINDGVERVADQYPDAPYVGTWTDPAGAVHIDPVKIMRFLTDAMATARDHGQQAVWDFAGSREIPVRL